MALDTSIYQNLRPTPQIQAPSIADSAQQAMNLSQLAMQQQQMKYQMDSQRAMRDAYAKNTGPDGKLNQDSFLSDLGKVNPQAAMQYQEQFSKMGKDQAEAQSSKIDALQKIVGQTLPAMKYLGGLPEDQRTKAFPEVMKQLADQGVPMHGIPQDSSGNFIYDPNHFRQSYSILNNTAQQLANQKTQAEIGKMGAETEKTVSETYKRNPDIMGQTNDPAKLVPGYVPKEHQAQAFKEIDAAENTRKMSQSILGAFDQAVKDTTGAVNGAVSMVRTPRSSMALHQAMQPTFKDLEGTVRQAAMDNTFKNITPVAGDTEKDIQTKRAALQDYLQSKLSAPTARAYGIDLAKFDSTAPYKSAPTDSQQGGGGAGFIKSAYASEKPMIKQGTVEGGFVYMGGDPGDQKSWKRVR